ncbi:MAG: butyryl-CoA dehydrogenase [Anaerolineae bacterium]|nr:acyl-CoA dehydrogenase family protein [Anaerolineae bacterium]MCQ3975589.1 butyryl-CoA dehydrogenase [Anaerolineae bacterium]
MDFSLNEEHQMIQDMVRNFSAREVAPLIKEYDRKQEYPNELTPRMAQLGLLGVCVPVKYGGAGMDYISLGIVSEALEWADSSMRETISVHVALNSLTLLQWGSEAQKQKYLTSQARGEKIACFGLTEPGAGSDVAAMTTRARREGDCYILNGEKMWITLADTADNFLIFAKTDPAKGHQGISAFIVERSYSGVTTGTIHGKMGARASNTGWINLNNTVVPAENLLGLEGEGFKIAMSALDNGRYTVAAGAVGLMRACLEESVRYANQRITFGQVIGKYQLVQQMIARMVQRIELAQLYVHKVGWLKNQGLRNTRETSLAKWFATEAAWATASDAVQIFGAYGYSDEYNVERYLRNSKSAVIYEGTSQIHELMQGTYALGYREDSPLRCELPAYNPDVWQIEV